MFKKFQVEDLMFVEYHCLFETLKEGYWTDCNYLIYIVTGKKKWRSLDKTFEGNSGDAVFIKKGAYIIEQFFDEEFCSLLIFLPDDFIRSVMKNRGLRNPGKTIDVERDPILQVEMDGALESYFHSVLSYFPQQRPPGDSLLRVKFEEFIINILSNPHNPGLASYFDHIRSNSKVSIKEIMEVNFASNLNLTEFAKLAGRSLSTFHRDFRKEYGTSPRRWLTQKRLAYAKLLLETTDYSINEVAFESGFENPSHFIRIFKDKYQSTPLRFKQAAQ
jgi:AraC-like DNA-binding protein